MKRKLFTCLFAILLIASLAFSVSALEAKSDEITYIQPEYDTDEEFDAPKALLTAFGAGLVIGLITVCVMCGQLKSVRSQRSANQYVEPGSMNVTHATDLYLYRNVTKIRIQNNNNK